MAEELNDAEERDLQLLMGLDWVASNYDITEFAAINRRVEYFPDIPQRDKYEDKFALKIVDKQPRLYVDCYRFVSITERTLREVYRQVSERVAEKITVRQRRMVDAIPNVTFTNTSSKR